VRERKREQKKKKSQNSSDTYTVLDFSIEQAKNIKG
jgi:hypothetical protein